MKSKIINFFIRLRGLHARWRAMTPEESAALSVAFCLVFCMAIQQARKDGRARKQLKCTCRDAAAQPTPTKPTLENNNTL